MATLSLVLRLRRQGGPAGTPSLLCTFLSLPPLLPTLVFLWGFASLLLFPEFSWAATGNTVEVERKEPPVYVMIPDFVTQLIWLLKCTKRSMFLYDTVHTTVQVG